MTRPAVLTARGVLILLAAGCIGLLFYPRSDGPIPSSQNHNPAAEQQGKRRELSPNLTPLKEDATISDAGDTKTLIEEQKWLTEARSPKNIPVLKNWLKEISREDPKRAMAFALSENNLTLRQEFRNTVLQSWASVFCDEATNWVMQLPAQDHHDAMQAVFGGAINHPDEATNLGRRLCIQDPTLAGDYGQLLITALTHAGNFEQAIRFAATDASVNTGAWLNAAYYQWAGHEPEQAWKSFERITEPEQRRSALEGIVAGWADSIPATLAGYVLKLEPGEDRAQSLEQALNRWVNRDPSSATEWLINNYKPSPDLDSGTATLATLPSLISRKPEIGVAWAESISDPKLRSETLLVLAREWAEQSPDEFRRFLASSPGLPLDEQTALPKGLEPPPPVLNEPR